MHIKKFENFSLDVYTWILDDSESAIENEQYDAQGEKQQFLSDEDPSDLFGDEIKLIPLTELKESVKNASFMISRQGVESRSTVDELKNAMKNGDHIPPITLWKTGWSGRLNLCSGRHRITAAAELGMTHVHCMIMYWRNLEDTI